MNITKFSLKYETTMPDRIELLEGPARWLESLRVLLSLVACFFILTASTPWLWKSGAIAALLLFSGSAFHRSARRNVRKMLLLRLDGSLRLDRGGKVVEGRLGGGAWVSRWVCVFHWTDLESGSRNHSLVCAVDNRPEDYRRLMVWLRLGVGEQGEAASC